MNEQPELNTNGSPGGQSLRKQVLTSMAWVASLNYLGQIFRWAVTIVVIRLLLPADFGLMAKAAVFISFLTMISELGLESAIIQKKHISEDHLTHVFGIIILFNILLFALFFAVTPLIADFYSDNRLVPILRVMSSTFIFLPLYILPRGLLMREMNFKRKSVVDLAGSLSAAGVTLVLALLGFGVWALVWGNIASHVVMAAGYNIARKGFIIPRIAIRGYSDLMTFGGYLTGSRILWYFYSMSDIFIGGKFLSNKLLGVYSVAMQLATIPIEKLMPIISQVAFPAYSRIQTEPVRARSHFITSVRLISFIIFPVYGGLMIIAPPLVTVFLGSKWTDIILPISLLCLIMPFRALSTLFSPVLNGLGRPDINFVNVAIASLILPVAFLIGAREGVVGMCYAWIIGYTIVFSIMSIRTLRALDIPFRTFVSGFFMPLAGTSLMILGVWLFGRAVADHLSPVLLLVSYPILGTACYLALMFAFSRDTVIELVNIVKNR